MVPVRESQSLEESGSTLIGAVSELTVADGQASMGDGPTEESVPLATVVTEHQGEQATLSLGWEGELPAPEVTRNQAVFTEGISIPVTGPATDQDQTPAPGQPAADPSPTTTTTPQASAPAPASSPASAPTSTAPSPSAGATGGTAPATSPVENSESEVVGDPVGEVAGSVVVDATAEGFSHQVVLQEDPGADVRVRFPIQVSKGLEVTQDPETDALRVLDEAGETVFFGSAPVMWDSAVDARAGIPTEVPVDSQLLSQDGTRGLLKVRLTS